MIMTAALPAGIPSAPPRKLRYVVAAAGVLVLVAVWAVAFSPLLGARTVTVSGTHTLTAAQVRTAAAISRGTALIRLDTGAVRKRVEKLPDVASATVTVAYPSTVRIKVTERVPVGYLANTGTGGSSYVLVDASGAQYREVAAAPAGLPRFALPSDSGAAATGHAVSLVAAALSPAVWPSWPRSAPTPRRRSRSSCGTGAPWPGGALTATQRRRRCCRPCWPSRVRTST